MKRKQSVNVPSWAAIGGGVDTEIHGGTQGPHRCRLRLQCSVPYIDQHLLPIILWHFFVTAWQLLALPSQALAYELRDMHPEDDIGSSQPFAYTADMSLTQSEADTGRGHWRRTLIQPVCIPNLHHTGIRSKFGELEDPIMTSDGSVTKEYKGAINKRLRDLPQMLYAADDRDMRRRDREKLCAKGSPDTTTFQIGSKVWSSGHVVRQAHAALHPPSSTTLPDDSDAVGHQGQARTRRLNVDSGRRLKHPYNNASLLRSLLDLTFEPPEKPYGLCSWVPLGRPGAQEMATLVRGLLRRSHGGLKAARSMSTVKDVTVQVTFINYEGHRLTVPGRIGQNLLEVADMHGIELESACGGGGAPRQKKHSDRWTEDLFGRGPDCHYCHVKIPAPWIDFIQDKQPPTDKEKEIMTLHWEDEYTSNSRLGCQVELTKELDGITVFIPDGPPADCP